MQTFQKLKNTNRFRSLGTDFYEEVEPLPLKDRFLIDLNPLGIDLLGIDHDFLSEHEWLALHNGELSLEGLVPMSSYYSGHQFGTWAGRLGDGRAHTLGEVNGFELQLKGSGMTPFSRMGDGRAVLRSTIREYLAGEHLHALGIPTTRSLGIIGSKEVVHREQLERGAIMIRLAPSFIRFGTFEYFASEQKTGAAKKLLDFVIEHYYPEILNDSSIDSFYTSVISRTARLVAKWMAYGFCHGVMNTDNMSILGLTIDYGPYGFLENYDPDFVCNHSDYQGRYSFRNQPAVAKWNLMALAFSLKEMADYDYLLKILEQTFDRVYSEEYWSLMTRRFGMANDRDSIKIIQETLDRCDGEVDLNRFLYELAHDEFSKDYPTLKTSIKKIQERTNQNSKQVMKSINPKFILKNWVAQTVIERVAKDRDYHYLSEVREVLQSPFDRHTKHHNLAGKTPNWASNLSISCSS